MQHAIIFLMDTTFTLKYEKPEVISAQRLRFIHSSRLLVTTLLGVLAVAYLCWQQFQIPAEERSWITVIVVAAIFITMPVLVYFVAPGMDFKSNKGWRLEYRVNLRPGVMDFFRPGETKPVRFDLHKISKIMENSEVFILFFGKETNFIILPKRIFRALGKEEWFVNDLKTLHISKWIIAK